MEGVGDLDNFDVRFLSSENDFIYNYGVNCGHSLSYSKVNRCLFLSSEAKQLYHSICDYAFGGKRDCYPSQARLRLELGWSKQTLNTYLDELESSGLISREPRQGWGVVYKLHELHKVNLIIHSEIVHGLKPHKTGELDQFIRQVREYRKSPLYKEAGSNPQECGARIREWFAGEQVPEPKAEQIAPAVPLPKVFKIDPATTAEQGATKKKRGRVTWQEIDVEEWNTNHFCSYFEDAYEKKFSAPYLTTVADRSAMKRLISSKDKGTVKQHIGNFIDLDFFDAKNIKGFTASFCQVILDGYLTNGSLPTYKRSRQGKVNEEWAEGLNDLFQ